jgi:hypothetical protein
MKFASFAMTLFSATALHISAVRAQSAEEIAAPFASVAGSVENAVKIARGLHSGKLIALRGQDVHGNPSLLAFGAPEGGMSWSEVRVALARAQATLAGNGIREATPSDVQAALLGGELKRNDGSAVTVGGVVAPRPRAEAFAAPSDGMPIYGTTPALPDLPPSTWGSYRPSSRPSEQIEHVTGIIKAGYLR